MATPVMFLLIKKYAAGKSGSPFAHFFLYSENLVFEVSNGRHGFSDVLKLFVRDDSGWIWHAS
jgi:hypothetical protein